MLYDLDSLHGSPPASIGDRLHEASVFISTPGFRLPFYTHALGWAKHETKLFSATYSNPHTLYDDVQDNINSITLTDCLAMSRISTEFHTHQPTWVCRALAVYADHHGLDKAAHLFKFEKATAASLAHRARHWGVTREFERQILA